MPLGTSKLAALRFKNWAVKGQCSESLGALSLQDLLTFATILSYIRYKMESDSKPTSLRLTEVRIGNLERIAAGMGFLRAGKGSIGMLMNAIADGVVELGSAQSNMGDVTKKIGVFDSRQLSWVEPVGPVYEEVPVTTTNPYVRPIPGSQNSVDYSETEQPSYPQRKPYAPVGVDAPVIAPVPSVPSNASKADKLDLLAKLGFKAGVKL